MISAIVAALLLQAASAEAPPVRKEVKTRTEAYPSSEAYRACLAARVSEVTARMAYLMRTSAATQLKMTLAIAATKTACAGVKDLAQGAVVEASSNPGACAVPDSDKATPKLVRVRLVVDISIAGCAVEALLRDPVPF